MLVVKLKEYHGFAAFTFQWVITKGMKNASTPLIKASEKMMFFPRDGMVKMFINLAVTGVKTSVADHLKVLFWDMGD